MTSLPTVYKIPNSGERESSTSKSPSISRLTSIKLDQLGLNDLNSQLLASEKFRSRLPITDQLKNSHLSSKPQTASLELNQKLVSQYQQGRIEGRQFGSHEERKFTEYSKVDKYGFISETELSSLNSPEDEKWEKKLKKREIKWKKMVESWPRYIKDGHHRKIIVERIYKGLPDSFRAYVWSLFLNLDNFVVPNEYEKLKHKLLNDPLINVDLHQVDLDINRTYRNHVMFWERYGLKQQMLFFVLGCYMLYNPSVGYIQSMAGVAAMLLMYFDEERAFWSLHRLISDTKYDLASCYAEGFPKLLQEWRLHSSLIQLFLPSLYKKMKNENLNPSDYSSRWFLNCFQEKLPFCIVVSLWDLFLFNGYIAITISALAVVAYLKEHLLTLDYNQALLLLSHKLVDYNFDRKKFFKIVDRYAQLVSPRQLDRLARNSTSAEHT